MNTVDDVIEAIKLTADPDYRKGQQWFGIDTATSLGLRVPQMRMIAKSIGKNHELALALWKTNIHEARHIAAMIADPKKISDHLMEKWLKDFNSWDIVDGCCSGYFRYSANAYEKAIEWTSRKKEYEKRAGFSMMAYLAVHDKKATDKQFEQFFECIYNESSDERNFVKKAVNWALRQIGKRNESLCKKAIKLAKEIKLKDDKASKWIAADALRELEKYLAEGKIKK
jgi:3-methyladenine DNA glycosylase AlkD